MYGIATDGWSWYVTRDGNKLTSLGGFGHRADVEAIAAAYNEHRPFPALLPSAVGRPQTR